jgi:septal ring factor EnvC (AmiA/AmiB activator)
METRFVGRGTVVTLALVVGLLVAATGVLVVLYVVKQGDTGRLAGEVARTERTIDTRQDRLASLESTVDELDDERSRLDGENRKLHACADPAKDSITAAKAGDRAALDKALDEVVQNCER